MKIEEAIHEILSDVSNPDAVALSSLLATDRIVTGTRHSGDLPYAGINLESDLSEYRSSHGAMRKHLVRIQLWHENHSQGCQIRDEIAKLFENKSFTTTNLKIVCSHHTNSFSLEEDDGTWQFNLTFEITATEIS